MKNTNISKIRKELGYTQEKVAEQLNIAKNTLSQWENGKREPDFKSIKTLATFFNCSIDYLLDYEKEKKPEQVEQKIDDNLTDSQKDCIELIKRLDEKQTKYTKIYLKSLLDEDEEINRIKSNQNM